LLRPVTSASCMQLTGFDGEVWHLDDAGRAEADTAREWVEGIRRRALVDMRHRVERDFRPCTEAEAQLWVGRLTAALDAGIRVGGQAYVGAVEAGSATALKPASVDFTAIFGIIDQGASEDVAEFLRAAALAALARPTRSGRNWSPPFRRPACSMPTSRDWM
jgi:hypothetical protein